jgi:hypothetical protein
MLQIPTNPANDQSESNCREGWPLRAEGELPGSDAAGHQDEG